MDIITADTKRDNRWCLVTFILLSPFFPNRVRKVSRPMMIMTLIFTNIDESNQTQRCCLHTCQLQTIQTLCSLFRSLSLLASMLLCSHGTHARVQAHQRTIESTHTSLAAGARVVTVLFIVVSVVKIVVMLLMVVLAMVQLSVGNLRRLGEPGRLQAPILIHRGKASPSVPPTTAPCIEKEIKHYLRRKRENTLLCHFFKFYFIENYLLLGSFRI